MVICKVTCVVVLKCLFHYHHFVGSLAPPFLLCLFSQDYLKKNNFYICCNLFLADPLKINVMTILRKDKRACSYRISFRTVLVAIRHLYPTTLLIRYFFNVLVCMQFSCYPINNENTKIIFRQRVWVTPWLFTEILFDSIFQADVSLALWARQPGNCGALYKSLLSSDSR